MDASVERISQPAAAFFDLDKTVISRYSTLAFGRPFYQYGLITRGAALRCMTGHLAYRMGGASHGQMERARDWVAGPGSKSSGSKRWSDLADTAGGPGFVPVVVQPRRDFGGDESDAAADLVERNAAFGDQAPDVALGDVVVRDPALTRSPRVRP